MKLTGFSLPLGGEAVVLRTKEHDLDLHNWYSLARMSCSLVEQQQCEMTWILRDEVRVHEVTRGLGLPQQVKLVFLAFSGMRTVFPADERDVLDPTCVARMGIVRGEGVERPDAVSAERRVDGFVIEFQGDIVYDIECSEVVIGVT
ncbi:MAG: hypothetical protein ABL977_16490 [Candidatus Eisenbacteria bacterium]